MKFLAILSEKKNEEPRSKLTRNFQVNPSKGLGKTLDSSLRSHQMNNPQIATRNFFQSTLALELVQGRQV